MSRSQKMDFGLSGQFARCKLIVVRVIKRKPLLEFGSRWPAAVRPLEYWYRLTLRSNWQHFRDVVTSIGQTDQACVNSGQTVCVFDIGGNKFRLIARVSYAKGKVYVLRVLTHKEYDKRNWVAEL